jgi:hypothetical protein
VRRSKPLGTRATCERAYGDARSEIDGLLTELRTWLRNHDRKARGQMDWGYVGDLNHVASVLHDLLGHERSR